MPMTIEIATPVRAPIHTAWGEAIAAGWTGTPFADQAVHLPAILPCRASSRMAVVAS
jgi:hypothetical protein